MAAPFFRLDASPRAPARGEDSLGAPRDAFGAGYPTSAQLLAPNAGSRDET